MKMGGGGLTEWGKKKSWGIFKRGRYRDSES